MTVRPPTWQDVHGYSYALSIPHRQDLPTFVVLGKRPDDRDKIRPIICSGRIDVVIGVGRTSSLKLRTSIAQGVLPTMVEDRILKDAREGRVSGHDAAVRRWRNTIGVRRQWQ